MSSTGHWSDTELQLSVDVFDILVCGGQEFAVESECCAAGKTMQAAGLQLSD